MSELASLPLFHRIAGQNVLVLGEGPAAAPKRRLVERAGGIVIDDQQRAVDEGVRIAFIAFEDAKACEVAAINCRCAGMLVNVVDRPDLCDFTTPSILDRDPVLVAIGTNGASAGLAKHVRLRLERILPQTLGRLAKALFAARPALRERYPDGSARRRAIDSALGEGGVLDPFNERSHERVEEWSSGSLEVETPPTGIFAFDLSSADPDNLTIRQARLLGEADAVCCDGAVPAAMLSRARADAERRICDPARCRTINRPDPRSSSAACPKADPVNANELTVVLRWRPSD